QAQQRRPRREPLTPEKPVSRPPSAGAPGSAKGWSASDPRPPLLSPLAYVRRHARREHHPTPRQLLAGLGDMLPVLQGVHYTLPAWVGSDLNARILRPVKVLFFKQEPLKLFRHGRVTRRPPAIDSREVVVFRKALEMSDEGSL